MDHFEGERSDGETRTMTEWMDGWMDGVLTVIISIVSTQVDLRTTEANTPKKRHITNYS